MQQRGECPLLYHHHGDQRVRSRDVTQAAEPLADELLGAIDEADREGLHPEDYHLLASRELMDQALAERADGRASEPHLLADLISP